MKTENQIRSYIAELEEDAREADPFVSAQLSTVIDALTWVLSTPSEGLNE